jgi:predicted Zn finger-like uncharacterized protein
MALATKCPQCGALFRVVADQLKLRGGLVRCGQCRAVFDAIGSLTYVDEGALAQSRTVTALTRPASPPRPPPPASTTAASRQALGPATTLRIAPTAPATLAGIVTPRANAAPSVEERPAVMRRSRSGREGGHQEPAATDAGVPTLIAPQAARPTVGTASLEDIEVIELPPPPPDDAEPLVTEGEEPDFIRSTRRRSEPPRGFSIVFSGGALLLALLMLAQLAVIFRGELLMRWPQTRLTLVDLCAVFNCTVNWPMRADQLAVIGSELQAVPGTDVLELTTVVRNRAAFRQSLPALEVTLTDTSNRALARKVFTPADYLAAAGEPSSRVAEGFGPGSDYTIRIFIEARGVQAAGFLVYPFYL